MTTRLSPRWRTAVAGLTALLLAAGAAGTAHAAEPLVLDHGHIDAFHVEVEDGELVLGLREDVTGSHVRHAPEGVLLRVKEEAWTTAIPEHFPGAPEGYVLPLTQDPDLIWPGWDTTGVAGSGHTDVSIEISDVDGPGAVHLYTLAGFGTPTSVLVGGGFELPGTIRESVPAHTHAQWTFAEAGEYELTVRATATDPGSGATLTSGTQTYTFAVGDTEEPGGIPSSLAIEGLAHHYHTGDAVELTAVPDAETDLDHYHWYTRDDADGSWAVVPGLGGAEYTGTAETDGQQIKAALFGDDHAVVAESAPVTVRIDDHHGEEPVETRLTVQGAEGAFQPGDAVELTAVQDPETGLDHYHWFTRAGADAGWQLAGDAGAGAVYAFTATEEIHGHQVQARLYDDHHDVVASSEPVTLDVRSEGPPGKPGDQDDQDDRDDQDGKKDQGDQGGNDGDGKGGQAGTVPVCLPHEETVNREVPSVDGFSLVLDHGHVDAFHVTAENGELGLDLREDVTGSHVRHAPEDVLLHVRPEAWTEEIPDGYPGGPSGYLLPLTQDPDLLWPGWDTGGVAGSGYTDVSIEISDVNGPGEVYLYTTSTFGGAVPVLVDGGFELPGTIRESAPAHTHAQWTFAEAGEYELTVRATATDPGSGATLTSGTQTYTFAVGELPRAGAQTVTETVTVGRDSGGEECELPGGAEAQGGDGNLALTGGPHAAALLLAGAGLLAGGGTAVAIRRRMTAAV